MDKVFPFELVFIIGAPRSGTNMLRNIISSFAGCETWPCDEINYIWRHGNIRFESDEFPPELATKSVKEYLQRTFENFARKRNAELLVEKTCANSLRIPFLNAIFPDAKFIFIYRDGFDVVASAKRRWTASFDLRYTWQKFKYVPPVDVPYYGLRYLYARAHRIFSHEKRLAFWGPTLSNMKDVLNNHSLNEICAIQWQRCVEMSERGLQQLQPERVHRIRYESFVNDPEVEILRILQFLGVKATELEVSQAVQGVSNESLGKGRVSLGTEEAHKVEKLIGATLKDFGYL